jgi:hypothetical protein
VTAVEQVAEVVEAEPLEVVVLVVEQGEGVVMVEEVPSAQG